MQEGMTSQQMVDALMLAVWRRGKPVAFPPHAAASWGRGCQLVYCSTPCKTVDVSAFVNVLVVREELAQGMIATGAMVETAFTPHEPHQRHAVLLQVALEQVRAQEADPTGYTLIVCRVLAAHLPVDRSSTTCVMQVPLSCAEAQAQPLT